MREKNVKISKLTVKDISTLVYLINKSGQEYSRFFIPFPLTTDSFIYKLKNCKKDKYWGIFINNKIVGFYMLRGFDEGYVIPSYGVWISREMQNKGLATFTLAHASSYCKLNNIPEIMLKVHPNNINAKISYEKNGFKQKGIDKKNLNLIYKKRL